MKQAWFVYSTLKDIKVPFGDQHEDPNEKIGLLCAEAALGDIEADRSQLLRCFLRSVHANFCQGYMLYVFTAQSVAGIEG
jgi:hypothetical protein